MTDSRTLARPPQVTMAAWTNMVGSALVLISLFSFVANLRSIETRERVGDAVEEPPASWFGLDVEGYLNLLHSASLVTAACAVAAGILGWHVRARSRSARTALSVVAVPLLISGALTEGFMSGLMAFSVVLLWLKPARDWFNGITPTPTALDRSPVTTPVRPGQPGPPPHATPYGVRPAFTNVRPIEVLQACVITWVSCGIALAFSLLGLMGVLIAPDAVRDAWERTPEAADAGLAFGTLKKVLVATLAIFAVWSLAAIVVTVFAFVGRNWARIALISSAGTAAVVCLLGAVSSLLMLIPLAACGAVLGLLIRPGVTAWYMRRP